ncbi:alpha/beta-hydrolase [Aureobasidium subglaciale]|nr:alpha/beta-hydrolase [Aureobasidium subglaciale]
MDVLWTKATPNEAPGSNYKPFGPSETILAKGTQHSKGGLSLPCDIKVEREVQLTLRDGVKIYADVFRPATDEKVPAIINWAPYGKGGTGEQTLDDDKWAPKRVGIPPSALSGLQSWEGSDPAYWVPKGYAIVQVDARGCFHSEGDIRYFGNGEGEDGHDAVEEIASLSWCTGKIGLSGNSYLAISQWQTAVQRPPSLSAIAPWEGACDIFRNIVARGGVPTKQFSQSIQAILHGNNMIEDLPNMLDGHPTFDAYWATKVPDISRIEVPAYVVASYCNVIHVEGTFWAYSALKSKKWLRVHDSLEWPDFYSHQNDLRRFFDTYLKGMATNWEESTPAVRLSILNPGHASIINRAEDAFPPSRVTPRQLHLCASSLKMQALPPTVESKVSYEMASKAPSTKFTMTIDEDFEIIGFPLATLYMSSEGYDDMDVYVSLYKTHKDGTELFHKSFDLGIPLERSILPVVRSFKPSYFGAMYYAGPDGVLRASQRGLHSESTDKLPKLALDHRSEVKEGIVYELEIPLKPTGMRFQVGEQLTFEIRANNPIPTLPGLEVNAMQKGTLVN